MKSQSKVDFTSVSTVKVGLYIKSLQLEPKINQFKADLYWWILYSSDTDSLIVKDIENIEFVNGEIDKSEIHERLTLKDTLKGTKYNYLTGRVIGRFKYFPEYSKYPFDQQVLPIIIENTNLTSQIIKLEPDFESYNQKNINHSSGLAEGLQISSYDIEQASFMTEENIYSTNFGDKRFPKKLSYSRLTYQIIVSRNYLPYLIKILIPLTLIVVMAYLVFFVPAKELEVAVGLTVTSLLSCIALQLTMADDLPSIGYLVSSDQFFYLGYFVITLAMTQTVVTYNMEKSKKLKSAQKLEIAGRWIYPLIYIVGLVYIIAKSALKFV